MNKQSEAIRQRLKPIDYEVWQDRPYTAVSLVVEFNGTGYQAFGFSKVCRPDWWMPERGIKIAKGRAECKIVRMIQEEQPGLTEESIAGFIDMGNGQLCPDPNRFLTEKTFEILT